MRTYSFLLISFFCLCSFVKSEAQFGGGRDMGSMGQSMGQSTMQNQQSRQKPSNEDDEPHRKGPDFIVMKDQGLSLGIDLSPIIMQFINKERKGLAVVGRYGIKNRWFAAGELGFENINYKKETYSYKSNGTFIRLGVDYDIFNSEDFPTNDNIFIGLRYAYAWQTQESEKFVIVDEYWGDYTGSVGSNSVNSHSADFVAGLRCEVLRNFYMGWTFRARFLIASSHADELKPYAIAGYGKYDNHVNIGFTYTLEYQIPFNKLGKKR